MSEFILTFTAPWRSQFRLNCLYCNPHFIYVSLQKLKIFEYRSHFCRVNRGKSFDPSGFEATGLPSEQQFIYEKSITNNNFLLLQQRGKYAGIARNNVTKKVW
ncbi:MAG: hypothetical protein HC942_29575 [Microcoleus sp. SU_5_6]|nr:hypothetical protein [Microcoleus sp. SU_5_6]